MREGKRVSHHELSDRLFIGVFPAGISYADRHREKDVVQTQIARGRGLVRPALRPSHREASALSLPSVGRKPKRLIAQVPSLPLVPDCLVASPPLFTPCPLRHTSAVWAHSRFRTAVRSSFTCVALMRVCRAVRVASVYVGGVRPAAV